jgi:hypothetical protein
MLLVIRIITILVSIGCLVAGGWLIVAGGLLEKPADTGAVWLGLGIMLFYAAILFLLYRSYKKKHTPTHWVALILSVLPPLVICILILILGQLD